MRHHDLRSFLAELEHEGQLKRIAEPLDPRLEITALCQRAQRQGGPALLIERPHGSSFPFLGNLFGSEARVRRALTQRSVATVRELGERLAGLKEPQWPGTVREALASLPVYGQLGLVPPRRVEDAPFLECSQEGEAVDLGRWPVQTCHPDDAGPLITLGLVITQGPRGGRPNVAVYRMQVLGPRRVILRWLAHRGGALHYAAWREERPTEPFPVAVALGADPATTLAAVAPVPDTLSEYEFAGLLRGARGRLWRSPHTGLDLPAGAEIAFEGHVQPGEAADEGPFGDHTGYYNAVGRYPVLTVERLWHRRGAIYQGSWMGRPPHDEPSVLASVLNDLFVPILQKSLPEIRDFYLPPAACSYRVAVVSIRKRYPGHARRIMMAVWSYLRQFTYTKIVIVTDDDIDVRRWDDVLWAVSTRADPERDCLILKDTPVDVLDFASPTPGLGGKLGIDATHKGPAETGRTWGRPIRPDPATERRIDEVWSRCFGSTAAAVGDEGAG